MSDLYLKVKAFGSFRAIRKFARDNIIISGRSSFLQFTHSCLKFNPGGADTIPLTRYIQNESAILYRFNLEEDDKFIMMHLWVLTVDYPTLSFHITHKMKGALLKFFMWRGDICGLGIVRGEDRPWDFERVAIYDEFSKRQRRFSHFEYQERSQQLQLRL